MRRRWRLLSHTAPCTPSKQAKRKTLAGGAGAGSSRRRRGGRASAPRPRGPARAACGWRRLSVLRQVTPLPSCFQCMPERCGRAGAGAQEGLGRGEQHPALPRRSRQAAGQRHMRRRLWQSPALLRCNRPVIMRSREALAGGRACASSRGRASGMALAPLPPLGWVGHVGVWRPQRQARLGACGGARQAAALAGNSGGCPPRTLPQTSPPPPPLICRACRRAGLLVVVGGDGG